MQQAVGRACKAQPMRCTVSMTCEQLKANWRAFETCIQARQALMDRCFHGGDDGHRSKVNEGRRGQEKCGVHMYDKGCDMTDLC